MLLLPSLSENVRDEGKVGGATSTGCAGPTSQSSWMKLAVKERRSAGASGGSASGGTAFLACAAEAARLDAVPWETSEASGSSCATLLVRPLSARTAVRHLGDSTMAACDDMASEGRRGGHNRSHMPCKMSSMSLAEPDGLAEPDVSGVVG